jgi:hypothetical protein
MIKGKSSLWTWLAPTLFVAILTALLYVDESREAIFAFFTDAYYFIKKNILAILTAFFLVKGKFIIKIFLRKIILLSATGLGKRYMVERVLTYHFKMHFIDPLKNDFSKLTTHIKQNFQKFPLVKKIMAVFVFIGSLGFVGKFAGGMLAFKVFFAQIWSFLLAVFLKLFTAIFYFLTKVLWGSWLAPIFEVLIFSWLLTWMEKVPFLKKILNVIYGFFKYIFAGFGSLMGKVMGSPLRRSLKWIVREIRKAIYRFIGYKRVAIYKRLREARKLNPNAHTKLMYSRKERRIKKSVRKGDYISAREILLLKRKKSHSSD